VDKLSQRVKELMLTYPMLYPSRFHAMVALYSGNGGCTWGKDGTIVSNARCDKPADQIDYSDIDRREADLVERRKNEPECLRDLNDRFERESRLERLQRQFVEANIDLIASTTLREPGSTNWESLVDDFSTEFTDFKPIYNIPENVEESFREGAEEMIDELTSGLYSKAQANQDRGVRAALLAVQKQLRGQIPSESAKQAALVARIATQLKSSIRDEGQRDEIIEQIRAALA
jgi:hypothetical protein